MLTYWVELQIDVATLSAMAADSAVHRQQSSAEAVPEVGTEA